MTNETKQISNGMNKKTLLIFGGIGIVVILGLVLSGRFDKRENLSPPVQSRNQLAYKSIISNEGGVEVAVTPVDLSPDSPKWSFDVSLTTHSVELSEDLALVSKLILDSGRVLSPVSWEGDPPGGHHRGGLLSFVVPNELISSITLKILEVGGVVEREFKWSLK